MKQEVALKIKEEVEKQWNVANIVSIPKKDGKIRMCVDYKDLNKASPKDNFPLPHIVMLVDNTAQHAFYSFMDGFSEYNHIQMAVEDKEKTTFTTTWGKFAANDISKGYGTLFHNMMHKEVEVYMDDMIAKSRTLDQHVEDLRELFERLRKYKLGLNPAKCTFKVKTGKLLGFIIDGRGIEVDPNKVKVIRNMPAPRIETEVRGFLGRVNYIARLISQLTATCSPIFKLLRKNQKMEWNQECQEAFEKVKQYLETPPILVLVVLGKPMILYLTVLEESMGCVLGQLDASGKNEQAIHYFNKNFTDCEQRYPTLERTCCALVWTVKRLRQYMLAHTTWLIFKTNPVKYIFQKPALTGRIVCWQMALLEYDSLHKSKSHQKERPG
ncbi:Retrovirus-related Pol polyprotein from transposon 17.6, partial [Mucuna pruriens]